MAKTLLPSHNPLSFMMLRPKSTLPTVSRTWQSGKVLSTRVGRGSPDPAASLDRRSPIVGAGMRPAVGPGAGSGDPRTTVETGSLHRFNRCMQCMQCMQCGALQCNDVQCIARGVCAMRATCNEMQGWQLMTSTSSFPNASSLNYRRAGFRLRSMKTGGCV